MKEPEVIQRFPEAETISDENDTTKLFNKDHNYFSVEEKCGVLMSDSLAKNENGDLDKNALDSVVSDDFRNGKTHLLSLQSENQEDCILPGDITRETSRINRPRFDARFRTNSLDSAFSEDSLIDFEGGEDSKLESIIDQLIFYPDDLQTDLSSYVKSDNNSTFNDIDSFDVNDLFCSDAICDDSQMAAVHSSDLVNAENTSDCEDPHIKQQSHRFLIKPDTSFPTVDMNEYPELETRQSTNHTSPSSQLMARSDVAAGYTNSDHVGLDSLSPINTDILKMSFSHKGESLKKDITISPPKLLPDAENYGNVDEYCVIDINGNVQKDNTALVSDNMKSSPGAVEQKDDLMKIKMESSGNVLELDRSKRQCRSQASDKDVSGRNEVESDTLKGDNSLLEPLCFFDTLDSYDMKKSYKGNKGMVFSEVFESESGRSERNGLKTPGNVEFDEHIEMKSESSGNTLSCMSEQLMMENLNGRKLNSYLSQEKHTDIRDLISNKDRLKSVLKDLVLNKDYFEQDKTNPLSPTEQKASVEEFNTKLLRSLDVLAILSPQSQGSNETEMLIESADNEVPFKTKKRSVHNMNFLTKSPQQPEGTSQENAGGKTHESEMADSCFGSSGVYNREVDFEKRSTDPDVLSFKKISEKIESNFSPSFKISSNDSDTNQIKVPRLSLNRKHSVDSVLMEDSLLRKVLTGNVSSQSPFFTNGRCVNAKQKHYQTMFQNSIDLSNCPIVNKTFAGINKFPRDKSIGMSELEKYLRGLVPTVGNNEAVKDSQETNTDFDRRLICPKYPGRSFLKRLLTGEINSDMYFKIDAKLCKQERFSQLVRRMNMARHYEYEGPL